MVTLDTKANRCIIIDSAVMRVKEVRRMPNMKVVLAFDGRKIKLRGHTSTEIAQDVHVELRGVRQRTARLAFAAPSFVSVENLDSALYSELRAAS